MQSKTELRQAFRSRLSEAAAAPGPSFAQPGLSTGGATLLDVETAGLNQRLVEFLRGQEGCWAAFQPTGFEPDIRSTFKTLENIDWVFPRIEGSHMRFFRPRAGSILILNKWGILEPDPQHSEPVPNEALKGLLVPGLGFDLHCNRLGRGGGFYDRFFAELKTTKSTALKIGIALDRQIFEGKMPVEVFDVPMDWVVTEARSFQAAVGPERKSS